MKWHRGSTGPRGQARRRARRRGSAFLHVLIAAVVLGAFAEIWRSSFLELNRSASRDPDRARARETADAAWARTSRALGRGEPAAFAGPVLSGDVTVEAKALDGGAWRVRIRAKVGHGSRGDPIVCELVIEATVQKGRVFVTSRRELGA